jgi:hypothetical protein
MEPECSLPYSQDPVTYHYLSYINQVHASTSHFLKINFNIIIPTTPTFSKWSLSLRSQNQRPLCTSSSPPHVSHDLPVSLTFTTTFGDIPYAEFHTNREKMEQNFGKLRLHLYVYDFTGQIWTKYVIITIIIVIIINWNWVVTRWQYRQNT